MAGADPGSGSQQHQGHVLHCSGSPKKLPHLSVARLLPSRNHEKTSHLLVVDELSATENFCLLLQLRSHFIVEGALPVPVVAHGHDDEVPRSQATGDSQLFLANLSRRWSLCSTNRPPNFRCFALLPHHHGRAIQNPMRWFLCQPVNPGPCLTGGNCSQKVVICFMEPTNLTSQPFIDSGTRNYSAGI